MPKIPVGYQEATFIFAVTGSVRQMTWSLGLNYGGSPDDTPAAMAEDIAAIWSTTGRPYTAANMVVGYQFLGVSVTKMLESGPQVGQYLATVTGTLSGAPMPNNCAVLLNKNTASGGRRGRGRAFLPPTQVGELGVDGAGFLIPGQVTAALALFNAARAEMVTQLYVPVLFHATEPFLPTPITGFTMSNQIATQRRRMRK